MSGTVDTGAYRRELRMRNQEKRQKKKTNEGSKPTEEGSVSHYSSKGPLVVVDDPIMSKRTEHPADDNQALKKLKVGRVELEFFDHMTETCSSSSINFAQSVSSLISFPGDKAKVSDLPLPDSNAQAMAHVTQAMLWMANNSERASTLEIMKKTWEEEKLKLEREIKDLNKNLQIAQDEIGDLEVTNSTLIQMNQKKDDELMEYQRKLHDAVEAQKDVESYYYTEGLKKRLAKVKEVFGKRYIDCLLDDEEDPLEDDQSAPTKTPTDMSPSKATLDN